MTTHRDAEHKIVSEKMGNQRLLFHGYEVSRHALERANENKRAAGVVI